MEIVSIHGPALGLALAGQDGLVSVAERAQAAFAGAYMQAGQQRRSLMAAGSDPLVASNPQALAAFQVRLAEHVHTVNLAAALTHHMTEGVETLLKS